METRAYTDWAQVGKPLLRDCRATSAAIWMCYTSGAVHKFLANATILEVIDESFSTDDTK